MSALLAAFISVCNCAWPLHLQWETARGISSSSSVSTFLLIHSSSCSASKDQAWESCARLWVPLECLQGRLTGKRTLELLQYLFGGSHHNPVNTCHIFSCQVKPSQLCVSLLPGISTRVAQFKLFGSALIPGTHP